MENLQNNKSAVDLVLDKQRQEGEARAILQDLEMLQTIPYERKKRWVWELLQNANDCAPKGDLTAAKKVNISFIIDSDKLTFTHDGEPFSLEEILALVRRTSTKSYDTDDGNTGKFGTGFVTSNVLNKKVQVSGLLKRDGAYRQFSICIDRTPDLLESLQKKLTETFVEINEFYEKEPESFIALPLTEYVYFLNEDKLKLTLDSIDVLKSNLPFTLLINPSIESVTIINNIDNSTSRYSLKSPVPINSGVKFSQMENGITSEQTHGLFHYTFNGVTIAIPVEKMQNSWRLMQIQNQARLFKEFPLIGTENWNIPFFVQSANFMPSEPRDGVRTLKENVDKPDKKADNNRSVLLTYCQCVINFYSNLKDLPVSNLILLVESGFPLEKTTYTDFDWFHKVFQNKLRMFFRGFQIVSTLSGRVLLIVNSKFPMQFIDSSVNENFYHLASAVYWDSFPNKETYEHWQRIISQDPEYWPNNIIVSPETLVSHISNYEQVAGINLHDVENKISWLDSLIMFLYSIGQSGLAETSKIYPNQKGILKMKEELRIDPGLNETMKSIGSRLKQPVFEQLLDKGITHRDGIGVFDEKAFFDSINVFIGSLTPSEANLEYYKSVIEINCIFNPNSAYERERWFSLINRLLPDLAPEEKVFDDLTLFNFTPAELASIKYVCWLIEQKANFNSFCNAYFNDDLNLAYSWLTEFIDVLYRNKDYVELIRKYAVIPMQSGKFKKLDDTIFREDPEEHFKPIFKDLFTTYLGKGDVKEFLIALEITNENLPWKPVDYITRQIDDIFANPDIEKLVEPDAQFNTLFHQLNDWFNSNEELGKNLFSRFFIIRPKLYVKAFGPEVSKMIVAILKTKKSPEEIEKLAALQLSADDLGKLEEAAEMVGGVEILVEIANEVALRQQEELWRKKVGDAAEKAFLEAISDLIHVRIDNPDHGFDFELKHPSNNLNYLVEIKSTVQFKESVQMSSTQGKTARDNSNKYALCVVSRQNSDDEVNKDYFIQNAAFLITVGTLVRDKVNGIENGLFSIRSLKYDDEASSSLDNEKYSVFVGKKAWSKGLPFYDFINFLKTYFNL